MKKQWPFPFPYRLFPIPSHSHSQFCHQFPLPWESHGIPIHTGNPIPIVISTCNDGMMFCGDLHWMMLVIYFFIFTHTRYLSYFSEVTASAVVKGTNLDIELLLWQYFYRLNALLIIQPVRECWRTEFLFIF